MTDRPIHRFATLAYLRAAIWLFLFCSALACATLTAKASDAADTAPVPGFDVRSYLLKGNPLLATDKVASICSKYTGPSVKLGDMVKAAADLQLAYHAEGYPPVSIAFRPEDITNGIVTLNVFQAAIPQIMVAGERWLSVSNGMATVAVPPSASGGAPSAQAAAAATTNAAPHVAVAPPRPAGSAQIARAYAALLKEMSEPEKPPDTRIHVPPSAGPKFDVQRYRIMGNTILSPNEMAMVLTNIDGAYGTNVSFAGVKTVVQQLEQAYHERGYVTVAVDVPRQTLANATVKLRVLEGRLAAINVEGNHYFSSNNVMRSLPSLHTNMVLNSYIFNSELNRANANQDRQIYPIIGPGPTPGTSQLTLNVKDRLPLHGKVEFNNESSPGTPDLRVNSSAVYDNLWQHDNALGVQYGFSPEEYKTGEQWAFYDKPIVDYYSAFYRLPLGNPSSIGETVANNANFGYDEATRNFRLPTGTGQPEMTLYASRATIDTGVLPLTPQVLVDTNGALATEQTFHQDQTINEDIGFQLSKPLPEMDGIFSSVSGGLDFKVYSLSSYATNAFTESSVGSITNNGAVQTFTNSPSTVLNAVPPTHSKLEYLPLSLNYDGSFQDEFGPATWGMGLSANLWYASSTSFSATSTNPPSASLTGAQSLQQITSSSRSSGYWVILRPSFSQQFQVYTNWITDLRADGQWASEPLVSVEQFSAGGVNSVRGYREGEVFGDEGWHLSLEQHTSPYVIGTIYDGAPLTVRGSVYIDYARVFYLDPPAGVPGNTSLCGTGFGFDVFAGSHWQAQFLFSWPLLSTLTTRAYEPFFNFSLTGQF